jgi:hypothetical protein
VCLCCGHHVTATEPFRSNGRVYKLFLRNGCLLALEFWLSADMPHCSLLKACSSQVAYRCVTVPAVYGERISGSCQCSYNAGTQGASSLFCHLGGVQVLHSVRWLIFRSPMENSTDRFATSSPRICLTVLLNALLLPRYSCSFRPQLIMPLLQFGFALHLFMDVHPLGAPRTKSSLVRLFRGLLYSTADSRPTDRSFGALIVSTVASSFGTSWCTATASVSSAFDS